MKKEDQVKVRNLVLIITLFLFIILIGRVTYLALSTTVDNINIQELASKRTTKTTILKANRGTIFDSSQNILAQDVASYTLIAYLDPTRTTNPKNPMHVVDKEKTALVLSAILNMDQKTILEFLNKDAYQTEFGLKGKGLTELEKDTILATNLPGLDFIETTKRYYPYGKFLSYLLGYAKENQEGNIIGELGIEKYYNKELTGIDGKKVYQKDLKGYMIAGTKELVDDKKDGTNIYLTIDNNVQFFVEEALNNAVSKYQSEEIDIIVANAKTGEILAYATTPSFDPNIRDIKNYLDPNSSIAFEPGSTMKIFTYMAALEAGVYKGKDTYQSGRFETKDKTIISDWNKVGWGRITYDQGFIYSSNTAVVNLMDKYLSASELKNYLKKLGFGSKTGLNVANEVNGKIDFKYETEIFNAAFGQGITVTPIQIVKALTSISNNGELLNPYIVKKLDDNGKISENSRTSLGTVATSTTVEYLKNLMWHTVNDPDGAAHAYHIDGFDLIGKTGTAQIASTNGKGYLTGDNDIIRSIALMFPKDEPEIIIYGAAKKPNSVNALAEPVKEIVKNISKYYNIYEDQTTTSSKTFDLGNYLNQDVDAIKTNLENKGLKVITIGDGNIVINQYPQKGKVTTGDKVFLVTNSSNFVLPNLIGYSKSDLEILFKFLNVDYHTKGSGYVVSQNIKEGTKITKDLQVEVVLENKILKEDAKE